MDGKILSILLVEDLEFGNVDDACLVEYEEDKVPVNRKLVCLQEHVPVGERREDTVSMKGPKRSVGKGKESWPYEVHSCSFNRKEKEGRCPLSVERLHDLYMTHKGKFVQYEVEMAIRMS